MRSRAQSGTIRNKLLKIGARLVVSVRRIVLHLSTGYPYANLFRLIVARINDQAFHDFNFG